MVLSEAVSLECWEKVMFEQFRWSCANCKKRSPTCSKGCADKLADDFFYYKYKKQKEVDKLFNYANVGKDNYQNKVGLANSKNNNHWLVVD